MVVFGYKAFYVDRDGKLFSAPINLDERYYFKEGREYYIDNDLELEICSQGYHFCERLTDVFNYYPFLKTIKYCQVEGLYNKNDDIIIKQGKIATRGIRIVKVLTWEEVLKQIQRENKANSIKSKNRIKSYFNIKTDNVISSKYTADGYNISYSDCVDKSKNVISSNNIVNSLNIEGSNSVYQSEHIADSQLVFRSNLVRSSLLIIHSNSVNNSGHILYSENILNSDNVAYSKNIKQGFYIIHSSNIDNASYVFNCGNLSDCLFCDGLFNKSNYLFNKPSSNRRVSGVFYALKTILNKSRFVFDFLPISKYIKTEKKYLVSLFDYDKTFDIHCLKDFPQEAIEYLKSLPEFDAEIFYKIVKVEHTQ